EVPHHGSIADPRRLGDVCRVDDAYVSTLGSTLHGIDTISHCHRSSDLVSLQVRGGGTVAEDEAGRTGPVLSGGDVAAVDDQLHTGHVLRAEVAVLGMVSLHDHEVRGLSHVVRGPAESGQFLVVVEGVVHGNVRAVLLQCLDHREHTGERGLLHAGAV